MAVANTTQTKPNEDQTPCLSLDGDGEGAVGVHCCPWTGAPHLGQWFTLAGSWKPQFEQNIDIPPSVSVIYFFVLPAFSEAFH